ncbi:MAG: ATP-binding cassette domain-containing protein [Betaproteobacteria bacterium]|nr:ATP-binding cassette domain-containing protein [Betaproteobacteria bacterium]
MILLDKVSKSYGAQLALAPTTLEFASARTAALIGPSGCGKSTLLRMIVGLVRPDSGRIVIEGEPLSGSNLERCRHAIGYVIQEGGLFPHLTAADNVTLLARHLCRDAGWIGARVSALAELVRIPRAILERFPRDLSGGQRQRVSLMRALILDPPVLLLDEPLGALDPVTRYGLQEELKCIFDALGKTVVLVTHDMSEAAYFGHKLVLLKDGRVLQQGALADLLERPTEAYVSEFIRAQRPLMVGA